ncbi:unnamed protein product [Rotaria sp. Silwood2]|nr:unnamed protein product [Rotaria sp. Silwood2]
MQRTPILRTSSSSDKLNDSSSSRVLIHSIEQTIEHTLPLNIIPKSSIITNQRTIQTQTTQNIQSSYPSKSIPSFAETQLLSVYYPSKNSSNLSNNDKCIFFEQQNRQPIRYRTTYEPLSLTKSTQTSPSLIPLSTHSSTLIIHGNNPNYKQHLKIHSGNQNLSNDFINEYSSPKELIEDSNYSYEEYIVNYDEKQNETSSSSSSSVTTVIAKNNELNSNTINNQRISSWPPVPDDIIPIDNQHENDEEKRLSRVKFAENLTHIIPLSTTNINEKTSLSDINSHHISEQLQQFDYQPINQSKSIQIHIDKSDNQANIPTTSNRVNTLRTLFEQQNKSSSILTSPIKQIEPKENLSKYGDEIRFHTKDYNTSTIHHAEPVQIIQHRINSSNYNTQDDQSIAPFKLDQIRQITGRSLTNLNDVGHYLQDGHTWQWNEIFWLSLTNTQQDQLKDLEYQLHMHQNDSKYLSLSTNDMKKFQSTINITGAGVWQQHKPERSSSNLTKYSEINAIDEINPSISIISSTPNTTDVKIDSKQILTSNKRTDNQITIIDESFTNPINSDKTNIDFYEQFQSDPLSYEQFIYDYLSTYAKQ